MFCLSAVALADAATEAEIGRLQTQLDQLKEILSTAKGLSG